MVWLWKSGRRYEKSQKPLGVGFGSFWFTWVCLIIFGKHGPTFKEEKTHQDGRCPWLYWTFKLYCANISRKSQFFLTHLKTGLAPPFHYLSSHPRRTCYFQHPMATIKRPREGSFHERPTSLTAWAWWRLEAAGDASAAPGSYVGRKRGSGKMAVSAGGFLQWTSILKWNWKRRNFKMNRSRERERERERDEKESIGHQRF